MIHVNLSTIRTFSQMVYVYIDRLHSLLLNNGISELSKCGPRVDHVLTTCWPRVDHVLTTCCSGSSLSFRSPQSTPYGSQHNLDRYLRQAPIPPVQHCVSAQPSAPRWAMLLYPCLQNTITVHLSTMTTVLKLCPSISVHQYSSTTVLYCTL
jgi:hypothetical protein